MAVDTSVFDVATNAEFVQGNERCSTYTMTILPTREEEFRLHTSLEAAGHGRIMGESIARYIVAQRAV